ncbi:MAG: aspartate aminotransferase family protein [bacterium]|nr:aspartate aminotransferase family protein [bacterium]
MIEKLLTIEEILNFDREKTRDLYKEFVNPGLARLLSLLDFDKNFVKAQGAYIWDDKGNKYIDFLGGYGALNLGHNHPEIISAIERVKDRPNILQASLNKLSAGLANNLAVISPKGLKHVFFCNSGAEAVESALKLARISTGRKIFVYCTNSFHGKTFGALSVTGRGKYRKPFEPLIQDVREIPFGDISALESALKSRDVAGFIVEPIQGEGGIIIPPDGYLRSAREICDRYGTLLIIDEIQTGFGRTGYMFACQKEDVTPDIMCMAKSLGGGIMPIGATISTDEVWEKGYGGLDRCLLHTSTFGGNSWAMSAGVATIDVIVRENLPEQARVKGEYFLNKLLALKEKYKLIKDIRGRGLMIGLEFYQPEGGILDKITGGGVSKITGEYLGSLVAGELLNRYHIITAYTLNNPNVIRLEPPLTISQEDLDRFVDAMEDLLKSHPTITRIALASSKTILGSIFKI